MISSCIAMRKAIEKARAAGIAISTVRNSGHFGAAGYYSNMAASSECIGVSMCNVDPGVTAPGSRGPVLGTNPISYAVPGPDGKTIFLDIATSIVAASKVFQAKATGQSIPEGWLIDGDGLPTTDPSEYPAAGALMPMAGHKGYGIALLVELLTGVLSGGALGSEVVSWLSGPGAVNQSLTFVAISIGVFMDPDEFGRKVDALTAQIHHSPGAVEADRISVPCEMEWGRRELALRPGVVLCPTVVGGLRRLAAVFSSDIAKVAVVRGLQ
jgi:LDH2 family malate/lactate/ureidoglycolate dehydrogenase